MKYLVLVLIFLGASCTKTPVSITFASPNKNLIEAGEIFCKKANSEIEKHEVTALIHNEFKCNLIDSYSCTGYKLQYRVFCKNRARAKMTYSFGNDESIIEILENDKKIKILSKEHNTLFD